jgi:hypothetical protein
MTEATNEADPFDAAFAEFTAPREKEVQDAPPVVEHRTEAEKDAQTFAPVEKPSPEVIVEDTKTAEEMEADLAAEAAAKAVATKEPVDNRQTEETLRRFTEALEKAGKPAPAVETVRQAPAPAEIYTPDEKAFLDAYGKDWADVQRGEALLRRAEYRQVVQYVFDQMLPHIKPLRETVRILAERTHLGDLEEVAPDYDDVREKVITWAAEQPTYLKLAYQYVIQNGSTEEVNDLIDRWRKDSGTPVAAVATGTTQATQAPAARTAIELTEGAKKAAARLAPVNSKRSGVSAGMDPSDFDAAFDAFAKQLDAK